MAGKVTTTTLRTLKSRGERAVFLTAYDYPTAVFADRAGADLLLIGDSAANTMLGLRSTVEIGMTEMLVFARAVARGAQRAFVIGDLPFLSYQPSDEVAILNAGAFIQVGCDAVKCEGGQRVAQRVRAMSDAGIAVMGHLGLTPQNLAQLGGYRVQGKGETEAQMLLREAKQLEQAGAGMIVLEAIPAALAREVTAALTIPTIGIGAGVDCSGQVLVLHDMLDVYPGKKAKFVKNFMRPGGSIQGAVELYVKEVKSKAFPGPEHSFSA